MEKKKKPVVVTPTEIMENPEPPEPAPAPPWFSRKAEDWEIEDKELPWQQFRCRSCNGETWGRQPLKHDLCEDCGYLLRREMAELEVAQVRVRTGRILNPFAGMPIPVKER